nr:thioredoxin family protein [Polynucleobacter necessarius]
MMDIKVLGTGCSNCKATVKLVEEVAKERGVSITMEKVEDIQDIMKFNIMSTPGVIVDGKVVHTGGIPSREKVEQWFA